jgi:hypothetical protein
MRDIPLLYMKVNVYIIPLLLNLPLL